YVFGESTATADASNTLSAFNQEIVMGANLQQNAVDMTVVGGNLNNTIYGEDGDSTGA
ncbi:PE-PGRS family protein, partial [Mesorhizobium alhagi CCNWXJ12-2]